MLSHTPLVVQEVPLLTNDVWSDDTSGQIEHSHLSVF